MPGRRLELTEDPGFQLICGDQGDGVYSIRLSRPGHPDWRMAAGDFLSFHEAMGIPFELALDRRDREDMLEHYTGFSNGEPTHSYNDPYLRAKEPRVLVHSTTTESWDSIREEGELLSWNTLKARGALREQEPIGAALGDPEDFRDYIMFGGGVTGELIVSSKQKGHLCTDPHIDYLAGARLYFDAALMARDGLLLRDGCHMKVRDRLPLEPYLIWAADWKAAGLGSPGSQPETFANLADGEFSRRFKEYTLVN